MAKRRIAAWKYFNGDTELADVRWFHVGGDGKPDGWAQMEGDNARFGTPAGVSFRDALETGQASLSFDHHLGHRIDWLRVEREVRYLTKPDPHQCDWRCLGAQPGGECWCACGGRNHGRNFRCD